MLTVIGQRTYEIETLVSTVHMYKSYGLPTHEMGRILDYRCMKHKTTSVLLYYLMYLLYNYSYIFKRRIHDLQNYKYNIYRMKYKITSVYILPWYILKRSYL